jgi:hypothetical protein
MEYREANYTDAEAQKSRHDDGPVPPSALGDVEDAVAPAEGGDLTPWMPPSEGEDEAPEQE